MLSMPFDVVDMILRDGGANALTLYAYLRRQHWPHEFVLTKNMAGAMPDRSWTERRWKAARNALRDLGMIQCLHEGGNGPGNPPRYDWGL
jgi:hypothetical protein